MGIQLQWVQGDSSKAEDSFFRINQQASPIDETEKRVLKARRQPNGIAARAIVRGGKGHKYWSSLTEENQVKIQKIAGEVNELLFNPELDSPIKTLDLPVGGRLYAAQSLPLVFDFVNIVNSVASGTDLPEDKSGAETAKHLTRCLKVAQRINSSHPGSLGLHPIVYFYSANGRHKIASFFAVTALIMDFERRNYYAKFTSVRERFERLLLKYDFLTQQIVRKYRSAQASYLHIKDFYLDCIQKLLTERDIDLAVSEVTKEASFFYLAQPSAEAQDSERDFTQETKSEAFIREALSSAPRCKICGGYIHRNAISIDHIIRKQDGGSGSVDNAQLTHPFCNSTVKN